MNFISTPHILSWCTACAKGVSSYLDGELGYDAVVTIIFEKLFTFFNPKDCSNWFLQNAGNHLHGDHNPEDHNINFYHHVNNIS
jgi:hypothetical protein